MDGRLHLVIWLIAVGLPSHRCASGARDKTCAHSSNVTKIKEAVFCSYDKTVLPVSNEENCVFVDVSLFIVALNYDEATNILKIHTHTSWDWQDAFIEWFPENYNELSEIKVSSADIWTPDTTYFNGGGFEGVGEARKVMCTAASSNAVNCEYAMTYRTMCRVSPLVWLNDVLECRLAIHSWTYTLKEVDIFLIHTERLVMNELYCNGWKIEKTQMHKKTFTFVNETYPGFELSIVLRRHSSGFTTTVVIPAFVLATLTLVTFWLDAGSSERLTVSCMNVLAHCLYLQYLGMKLPSNGETAPLVVVFFRDSLFLVGAGLLLSVILHAMLKAAGTPGSSTGSSFQPPDWLNTAMGWLLSCRVGQVVGFSYFDAEDVLAEGTDASRPANWKHTRTKTWHPMIYFIDRLFFLLFCVILFVLLMTKIV